MATVKTFTVVPKLPAKLKRLLEICRNLWWCWDAEAIELFFRIDRDLWVSSGQNPLLVLGGISQKRLEQLAGDDSYLAHLDRVYDRFEQYMKTPKAFDRRTDLPEDFSIAYLSAEFGVHESISIYSGGLGLLAGDHLKAASDLGLPLVGVGLLYREGYFKQYLNADGWQQELYPINDFYNMPIAPVMDDKGKQLMIEVEYPGRMVKAKVWKCQVGRVPLYLMDCDFDGNNPDDREITSRLYGGDRDVRIRQEIMLGVGGVCALRSMGIYPTTYHMNEGHAAFMTLERIRDLRGREDLSFDQAAEVVKSASVFTTHTPVPAGNDMFVPDMIAHYWGKYCADMGIPLEKLLSMGRQNPADSHEPFCMTVLAIKLSTYSNGVSKLHGDVARDMWKTIWTGLSEEEVPITSITNGVHVPFWISRDLATLYDRYMGPGWTLNANDGDVWKRIDDIPDTELWRTHERRRERLVGFARRRLLTQLTNRGVPQGEVLASSEALDPEVLTIGFARRVATYKRTNLLLMDPDRLKRLLLNPEHPLQIIIAGKAHPQDTQAKELIRRVIHFARDPEVRNRIIFIENYDINVARYMVQGVDCWLNTPRRPMEASGTSGMKAAANGALNISIPDGWWCEAELLGENGWSIGKGENYKDPDEQDIVESEALYEILEKEVVPMFYERGSDGVPRKWVQRMKKAIGTCCPVFNTHRMVSEYGNRFYVPCTARRNVLKNDNRSRLLALSAWKQKVASCWRNVHFTKIESAAAENLPYGTKLSVTVELYLDQLSEKDVLVELCFGNVSRMNEVVNGEIAPMAFVSRLDGHVFRFEGSIPCNKTGLQGFTARVIPAHEDLAQKHETCLVTWA